MNSIRALNVRTGTEGNSGSYPNPEPDTFAPSSGNAPVTPAGQPVPEAPAAALGSQTSSKP